MSKEGRGQLMVGEEPTVLFFSKNVSKFENGQSVLRHSLPCSFHPGAGLVSAELLSPPNCTPSSSQMPSSVSYLYKEIPGNSSMFPCIVSMFNFVGVLSVSEITN